MTYTTLMVLNFEWRRCIFLLKEQWRERGTIVEWPWWLKVAVSRSEGRSTKEKGFMSRSASVCTRLCSVCQIIRNPGCHSWVRELPYNEGGVPQLLPLCEATLNQERREKLIFLAYDTLLLSRRMWTYIFVYECVLVRVSESLVWFLYHTQTEYDVHAVMHNVFTVSGCGWTCSPVGRVRTFCLSVTVRWPISSRRNMFLWEYLFKKAIKHTQHCGFMRF